MSSNKQVSSPITKEIDIGKPESPTEAIEKTWKDFIKILHDRCSEDKNIRERAWKEWEKLADAIKITHLHRLFMENEIKELRLACLEELKTSFIHKRNEVIRVWSIPELLQFREELLRAVKAETEFRLKDELARLCSVISGYTGWKLKENLEDWATSNDVNLEKTALLVYAHLMSMTKQLSHIDWKMKNGEIKRLEFDPSTQPSHVMDPLSKMESLIVKGVHHEEANYRRAAVKALGGLHNAGFNYDLVPLSTLMQMINETRDDGSDGIHSEALNCIHELANQKKIREPDVNEVVKMCCKILEGQLAGGRSEGGFTATQIITVLCDHFRYDIDPCHIPQMLSGSLSVVGSALRSDEEWKADPHAKDKKAKMLCVFFSHIVKALSDDRVLKAEHLVQAFELILTNDNWKNRLAGFLALAMIAASYPKHFKKMIASVKKFVFLGITDTNPRVRYISWELFGFSNRKFVENGVIFNETDLGTLKTALNDPIKEVAYSAVCEFAEAVSRDVFLKADLRNHYDALMKIFVKTANNCPEEREDVFNAVLCAVYTLGDNNYRYLFMPYFNEIVGALSGRRLPLEKDLFLAATAVIWDLVGPIDGKPLVDVVVEMIGGGRDGSAELANLIKGYHSGAYDDYSFLKDGIEKRIKELATEEIIKNVKLSKGQRETLQKIMKK